MLTRQQKRKLFDGRKLNKLKKNAKKAHLKNNTGSKKIKDPQIPNCKNPIISKNKCTVGKNRRQVSLEIKAKRVLRSATKQAAEDLKVYRVLRSITKLVEGNKKGTGLSGSRNATAGNVKVIKMEDLFEGFSEEITQWEVIREKADLDLEFYCQPLEPLEHPRIKLLSRRDVMLYGTIPKMEQRMYSKCKGCNLVFNPRDVLSHKSCVGKGSVVQNIKDLKKNIKDFKKKIKNNKKTHSQTVPPSRPIFKKPVSPSPTVNSIICDSKNNIISHIYSSSLKDKDKERDRERDRKKDKEKDKDRDRDRHRDRDKEKDRDRDKEREKEKERSKEKEKIKEAHSDTKEANANSPPANHSNSWQSSKYKKSKKSSNKITKEFDPDVHCGVVEGNKGPCTRSITCSNHRIQLRKLVPGRSKDIHQLISERKAAKEKDMKPSNSSYTPLNLEENEIFCQNTSYVPLVTAIVSIENSGNSPNTTTYVPIMPKTNDMTVQNSSQHSRQTTSNNHTSLSTLCPQEITTTEPVLISNSKTFENGYNSGGIQTNSQESAIGTVPVVYMPMSPISVVSPVQFVKIGKNMICLESPQSAMSPPLPSNQSVYFTIPEQNNVKMYKTRPKPVTVPSFGTRRVGGAILLSNQRLESQRNDILMAINSKSKTNAQQGYKTVSLLNNAPHRPNILKVRSLSRINCKRPALDKVNSSDNKQSRSAPDVNGFILHADMSETADAPQPNHCIQEKIALLNMK